MSQYATVERVRKNIPKKRLSSVASDDEVILEDAFRDDIRIEIEQASAWVDSLYSDVAPFPSVGEPDGNGNGVFTELYVDEDSIEGAQVSIESAPAPISAGVELMFGTRLDLDNDPTVDYSIYELAEDVLEYDESITLTRPFNSESSGNGAGRRTILAGTPPLIRLATELMTRFNILTSGPNANMSKDISSLELRAAKLLNATVQVMSVGNVIEGPAYAEPHPRINIFRQSAPRDLIIILGGSITIEVNNDEL